jgi:hypothetical protein
MPITGTFEADFSQFSSATKAAENDLKGLQATAATTTTAVTGLEKATATTATAAGTLSTSWRSFDGALSAVGVHIGPQVQGLIDLGNAAGKSGTELGALASAGLVASAALAGWNVGRWIADITGADAAISSLTAKLLGWGDLAKQTAGAVQDSIDLAFQRTGIHANSAAEALALNTKWAKEHQAAAKEDAAEVKAAAERYAQWQAATEEVSAATKGYTAILQNLDPYVVAAATRALDHGVKQSTVATAYKLTETQIRAVAQAMDAEKKATQDAAAARREHDAEMMTSYNAQIGMLRQLEQENAQHFGLEGQIEQLKNLAAAEDARTKATYTQLDSEKDRMKLIEGNNKRQQEIALQLAGLEQQLADQKGASMARGLAMQKELNQAQGLDAQGAILLPQNAMTTYQTKVDAINATMQDGIEKTQALRQANQELADSFLKDAQAADTATTAIVSSTAAKTAAQTATDRANSSFGGGTLGAVTSANTSPEILSWMSKGYTLGEAIAIAMGQGAQIIGRSPTQLNAISGGNFRAAGGPVTAGGAYVVGERGPELFTPGVSGTISPTAPGAGGVAVAMTVNYPIMNDPAALDQLARLVGQAVMARVTRPGTLV